MHSVSGSRESKGRLNYYLQQSAMTQTKNSNNIIRGNSRQRDLLDRWRVSCSQPEITLDRLDSYTLILTCRNVAQCTAFASWGVVFPFII